VAWLAWLALLLVTVLALLWLAWLLWLLVAEEDEDFLAAFVFLCTTFFLTLADCFVLELDAD
jgi:hypothetical protein